MAKGYIGRTETEKQFIKSFDKICYRNNPWSVWRDFINMSACSIANRFDHANPVWQAREDSYLASSKAYTAEELEEFAKLFAYTVEALEANPRQDFLGNLYMNLDFGSSWAGQFFTPWPVAEMMARVTFTDKTPADFERKGYISVNDPACGAGCMLIAFAAACQDSPLIENYQTQVVFVGQDLDRVVAQMCYIQISLLGCPGYVIVGNTLTQPVCGSLLRPVVSEGCELWFTPMWYTDVWCARTIADRFHELFG